MNKKRIKILFLCTGNSCRSQMAEGFAKALKHDLIEAWSAGIETHGMNPSAIEVMTEKNIDLTSHHSKLISELSHIDFDYIITVCGHAHETCPMVPAACTVVHTGFDDPPKLALQFTDQQEQLDCYRRVRDEIEQYILTLPDSLP